MICMRCDKEYDPTDEKQAKTHLECVIVLPHPVGTVSYTTATVVCPKGHSETITFRRGPAEELLLEQAICWTCFKATCGDLTDAQIASLRAQVRLAK